jgi:hypothetical protein
LFYNTHEQYLDVLEEENDSIQINKAITFLKKFPGEIGMLDTDFMIEQLEEKLGITC